MKWNHITDENTRIRIQNIIQKGAQDLKDPQRVGHDMLILQDMRSKEGKDVVPWTALDLGRGYSGICLLYGMMDKIWPECDFDMIGHTYLLGVQEVMAKEGTHGLGLFSGLSGVIMAARALSRDGERYEQFIGSLNDYFLKEFSGFLQIAEARLIQGAAIHEFDVMQGMSGIGRYLLCFKDQPEMSTALERLLLYLIALCQERRRGEIMIPGWFTAPENQFMPQDRETYPDGHFNAGMSHGISGVLALLSIALMQGVEVTGQREATASLGGWLMKWQGEDEFGPLWPDRVSWKEYLAGKKQRIIPREAWCYGGPGTARALWLGGLALGDKEMKLAALKTFQGTAIRPIKKWNIQSHTMCHGLAGLLQMSQRMYSESGDTLIGKLRENLLIQLLDSWEPEERYGYFEINGSDKQNQAGLLDGAAGVYTVLAGLLQEQDTDWDCVFLIR